MQACAQGDAVNAGVQRRGHAHLQRLARRVHGQLLHAINKHQALATLGLHGGLDMPAGSLGQHTEIELNDGFIRIVDVVLVEPGLVFDKAGVKTPVRDIGHHGIRNMPDAAQPGRLKRQLGGGNIHAHTAHHDGHQFFSSKLQAEIVNTFHSNPLQPAVTVWPTLAN